jgi:hypothetical protein
MPVLNGTAGSAYRAIRSSDRTMSGPAMSMIGATIGSIRVILGNLTPPEPTPRASGKFRPFRNSPNAYKRLSDVRTEQHARLNRSFRPEPIGKTLNDIVRDIERQLPAKHKNNDKKFTALSGALKARGMNRDDLKFFVKTAKGMAPNLEGRPLAVLRKMHFKSKSLW